MNRGGVLSLQLSQLQDVDSLKGPLLSFILSTLALGPTSSSTDFV